MEPQQDRESTRIAVHEALLDLVRTRVHADPKLSYNADELFQTSLASVVAALLAPDGSDTVRTGPRKLDAEEVSDAYEYLRGFRLVFDRSREPHLEASAIGKRNQGLFYTPPAIVRHIVTRTLASMVMSEDTDFLSVKVLDPAVGTGAFLAEALEQLTARVFERKDRARRSKIRRINDSFRRRMAVRGIHDSPGEQTAVRVAILENCLYGVDLDPVAVAAARAVLVRRAFRGFPMPRDLKLKLRVGNALIGAARGDPDAMSRRDEDRAHATLYLSERHVDSATARAWARTRSPIHWPLEFPEVVRERGGFDAVVGNPPYEIVSVKESGIAERGREQAYFRAAFRTCQGKLNTYRLMMERGLDLLRDRGALGFIVPATLLADSTAEKLRNILMDEARILETAVIPEKARLFDRVTQALVILVAVKGERTEVVAPIWWDAVGPIGCSAEVTITRQDIDRARGRIPVIRTPSEKKLLDLLNQHPPLAGDETVAPAGRVHQGEVNLTVHRDFITSESTRHPLVRGEHVHPFRLVHPAARGGRLDWVKDSYYRQGTGSGERGRPWEKPRIVLGRVVNMATPRRLKAAHAAAGVFLGDMTNFVSDLAVPESYLIGLLNSGLLNWRIKITSTNNYLSAAEIENLPVPRNRLATGVRERAEMGAQFLDRIDARRCGTIVENLRLIRGVLRDAAGRDGADLIPLVIEQLTARLLRECRASGRGPDRGRQKLLDALVLELYAAAAFAEVIEDAQSSCPK